MSQRFVTYSILGLLTFQGVCAQPQSCDQPTECYCFLPSFSQLQCDCGIISNLDFLYLFAKENGLSYATRVSGLPRIIGAGGRPIADKEFYFDADWDPGFRVGLGYHSECSGWDATINWTYYHNKNKESESVPPNLSPGLPSEINQQILVNFWQEGGLVSTVLFSEVSTQWRLNYNVIDVTLANKFWVNRCFVMQPYCSLRGGWTKITFDMTGIRNEQEPPLPPVEVVTDITTLTNRYWGLGFVAGTELNWRWCWGFGLFANADISLLYGKFEADNVNRFDRSVGLPAITSGYDVSDEFFGMQPILDLVAGIRWEDYWCCCRYYFALDIGWEYHDWINHVRRQIFHRFETQFDSNIFDVPILDETVYDLVLSGLVIRARFDF